MDDRPPNCNILVETGGLIFSSCFDSGNLARAEFEANEYRLWVGPDCAGTPHETTYTAWFHFSVQGGRKGQSITLVIMNSSPLKGLYGSDMRPVFRSRASKDRWERLPSPVKAKMQGDVMRLAFRHRFEEDDDKVFFAFCYPWSYEECQNQLAGLDSTYGGSVQPRHPSIYYHRELLALSTERRRIDVLTISSWDGMRPEQQEQGIADPHVFPYREANGKGGPATFEAYKKVVFVSARVHPGETPASFVFNGLLSFLLREDDPRARQIRRQFVFKLVPMLNPDGVVRGHYRLDTQGLNLNRHYASPDPVLHPAIYAVRSLVLHLHATSRLVFYIDLHAHAAKKGCFFYGNQFERDEVHKQVGTQLFTKLAAMNSPFIEYGQGVFTEKNMKRKDKRDKDLSKEGAGRVALYRATGLTYFYTLECNYNEGTRVTAALRTAAGSTTTAASSSSKKGGTPPSLLDRPPRTSAYTSESWENVGEGVAIALLDIAGSNPVSRPLSGSTVLNTTTRVRRRPPSQETNIRGCNEEMFRSIRELVLATGNFDDSPAALSWSTCSSEWQWEGPAPEDDSSEPTPASSTPPSTSSSAASSSSCSSSSRPMAGAGREGRPSGGSGGQDRIKSYMRRTTATEEPWRRSQIQHESRRALLTLRMSGSESAGAPAQESASERMQHPRVSGRLRRGRGRGTHHQHRQQDHHHSSSSTWRARRLPHRRLTEPAAGGPPASGVRGRTVSLTAGVRSLRLVSITILQAQSYLYPQESTLISISVSQPTNTPLDE